MRTNIFVDAAFLAFNLLSSSHDAAASPVGPQNNTLEGTPTISIADMILVTKAVAVRSNNSSPGVSERSVPLEERNITSLAFSELSARHNITIEESSNTTSHAISKLSVRHNITIEESSNTTSHAISKVSARHNITIDESSSNTSHAISKLSARHNITIEESSNNTSHAVSRVSARHNITIEESSNTTSHAISNVSARHNTTSEGLNLTDSVPSHLQARNEAPNATHAADLAARHSSFVSLGSAFILRFRRSLPEV